MTSPPLSAAQRSYLRTQRLGRLATVDATGAPQNSPVGFQLRPDDTIVISGYNLGATRKFRNVEANAEVSLVIDDIASFDPWVVRGIEIRGRADALRDVEPTSARFSREQLVIHPRRVIAWGLAGQ